MKVVKVSLEQKFLTHESMGKQYRRNKRTWRKVVKTPQRPWEKERLDRELKICGQYGLRNKRELWRVLLVLSKIRRKARVLLTLAKDDPVRRVEGDAILRKCKRYGLLRDEATVKLDHVLGLTAKDFLERRLQTVVFNTRIAKSIHHARVLVQHGHILVGPQKVTIPSFLVRVESEKHVQISPFSSCSAQGPPGRKKKRRLRKDNMKRKGKKIRDKPKRKMVKKRRND